MTNDVLTIVVFCVLALVVLIVLLMLRMLGPVDFLDGAPIPRHRARMRPQFRELREPRPIDPPAEDLQHG